MRQFWDLRGIFKFWMFGYSHSSSLIIMRIFLASISNFSGSTAASTPPKNLSFARSYILKSVLITTAGSIKTIMEDWKEQCLSLMQKGSILNDHIKNVPSLSVP